MIQGLMKELHFQAIFNFNQPCVRVNTESNAIILQFSI